jgi:hypothetical protein
LRYQEYRELIGKQTSLKLQESFDHKYAINCPSLVIYFLVFRDFGTQKGLWLFLLRKNKIIAVSEHLYELFWSGAGAVV